MYICIYIYIHTYIHTYIYIYIYILHTGWTVALTPPVFRLQQQRYISSTYTQTAFVLALIATAHVSKYVRVEVWPIPDTVTSKLLYTSRTSFYCHLPSAMSTLLQ